jgi:hypothetical protein
MCKIFNISLANYIRSAKDKKKSDKQNKPALNCFTYVTNS